MALGTETVQHTARSSGRADAAASPDAAASAEPAASPELAASAEVATAAELAPAAERPLRMLILEDRAMDADLVIRRLRRSGFAIDTSVVSDEESYLAALDPPPDIILADYSLP